MSEKNNKPLIDIDLPPMLIDYLYHELANMDDGVMLTLDRDIGKYIYSLLTISPTPVSGPETENHVVIYLPTNSWNHHFVGENFLEIVPWRKKMLENYLMADFKLRVREVFLAGYEKGFGQDKIIKAFLSMYAIKNNIINYDSIKKMDYRNRKKITDEVKRAIQLELNW